MKALLIGLNYKGKGDELYVRLLVRLCKGSVVELVKGNVFFHC